MTRLFTAIGAWAAAIGTAAGLALASAVPAGAHPFSLDISKLTGFDVVTSEDAAMKARDMVVIEYKGPIAFPMAENLRTIWSEIRKDDRFQRVVLRLNSPGGTQRAGEDVMAVLAEIRSRVTLLTLVGDGDLCASMCVPVFIQGEIRHASPASVWMFHGATRGLGNIPSASLTARYARYFLDRGVGVTFLQGLIDEGYLSKPGEYWIAGCQLAEVSDIVTRVDPGWKQRRPDTGPAASILSAV